MRRIRLSAGTIEYEDTGGNGPVLVLLHGLAQNGSVWRRVVAELRPNHRCVVPTLPLGGHRRQMRTDADLSMHGISRLVVAQTSAHAAGGPARSPQVPARRGQTRHATGCRTAALLRASRARGVGGGRPRHAPGARTAARRTPTARAPYRDRRQLHAHPRGLARRTFPRHPRFRQRHSMTLAPRRSRYSDKTKSSRCDKRTRHGTHIARFVTDVIVLDRPVLLSAEVRCSAQSDPDVPCMPLT